MGWEGCMKHCRVGSYGVTLVWTCIVGDEKRREGDGMDGDRLIMFLVTVGRSLRLMDGRFAHFFASETSASGKLAQPVYPILGDQNFCQR